MRPIEERLRRNDGSVEHCMSGQNVGHGSTFAAWARKRWHRGAEQQEAADKSCYQHVILAPRLPRSRHVRKLHDDAAVRDAEVVPKDNVPFVARRVQRLPNCNRRDAVTLAIGRQLGCRAEAGPNQLQRELAGSPALREFDAGELDSAQLLFHLACLAFRLLATLVDRRNRAIPGVRRAGHWRVASLWCLVSHMTSYKGVSCETKSLPVTALSQAFPTADAPDRWCELNDVYAQQCCGQHRSTNVRNAITCSVYQW
jgi:hypothetical protein